MKKVIATTAFVVGLSGAASAATYVLDFDADPRVASEVATLDSSLTQSFSNPRVFSDGGLLWEVTTGGGVGAGLFDTTCSYGVGTKGCSGDPDLFVADQGNSDNVSGNVLIQQEPNSNPNTVDVDDDVNTSSIELKLLSDITLDWTGASAVDDGFYRFNFGATELGTIEIQNDNETGSVDFGSFARLTQNDVITVFFDRRAGRPNSAASGAVDYFTFNVVDDPNELIPPVPLPAGFPLLLVGAGALVALRRRNKG